MTSRATRPDTALVQFGFTLTHWRIAGDGAQNCLQQKRATLLNRASNIALNYENPAVHHTVRSMLGQMASAGASVARIVLWFRVPKAPGVAGAGEELGAFDVDGNGMPAQIRRNVASLIRDEQALGYHEAILAFAPIGRADPLCRRREYGDCYEPETAESAWELIRSSVETARDAAGNMPIAFEINEMCFLGKGAAAASAKRQYVVGLLSLVKRELPGARVTISCAARNAKQLSNQLEALAATYNEVGLRPAAIDIHIYTTDQGEARAMLAAGEAIAARLAVPLIVGETSYDNPHIFQMIARLKSNGALPHMQSVLIWPTLAGSGCNINVAPPYSFDRIKRELGHGRDGQR